ncbi:MAG: hypothetical protein SFX19_06945 [Alphaproteobacteria bacterium]|nr:hypothetical protein [Alphaproteobacteria bacterium]
MARLPQVILTPSNGTLALVVDVESGQVMRTLAMPPEAVQPKNRPFGIARSDDGHWFIANNTAVVQLNADLSFKKIWNNLPENIHQLYYDTEKKSLWVVATSIDSLLVINVDSGDMRRFCLLTDSWVAMDTPGADTQHFNSINWAGDQGYVVAHKFGRTSSFVRTYNRDMRRIALWNVGREAHNIRLFEGQMMLLDSRGGRIVGNQGLEISVCESHHYARGMIITEEGMAILSVFAFGTIDTRDHGDAMLRVFDLRSGERVKEIILPGAGNVQDIQLWGRDDGFTKKY